MVGEAQKRQPRARQCREVSQEPCTLQNLKDAQILRKVRFNRRHQDTHGAGHTEMEWPIRSFPKSLGVYLPGKEQIQGSSKKQKELGRAKAVLYGHWLPTAKLCTLWLSCWLWANPHSQIPSNFNLPHE